MSEYAQESSGAFSRSGEVFESLVAVLGAQETAQLSHAELEDHLAVQGRELLRTLLQDHLDLRAAREQRAEEVVGTDGVARTRVEGGRARQLATVFGQVMVVRKAYRALGTTNVYPADAVLNLPVEKHSHGLRRLAAIESVRGSFEQAQDAIWAVSGVRLGKRQVEQLAQAAAVDVEAFYAAGRRAIRPAAELLVLSADGKGIVMRPGALRAATARAAASTRHKLATRLSPGEKRGRKRMAEIGAVYDAVGVPRTATDVIAPPGRGRNGGDEDQERDPQRGRGPVATGKWLTASVTDDIPAVISTIFDEAERRDPHHQRPWVALVDGNTQQIEAIRAEARRRDVPVSIVVDFIHVLEYLWKAAWAFYYEGDPDAEAWVATQAVKILQGKAGVVAAAIRQKATLGRYSPAERANADAAAAYLTSKKPYLDYARALEAGWPIATGVIEGACRHLVKDRMDITGARWSLQGAEAILTLRALITNGDLDAYWRYHLRQEHQRVHHIQHRKEHALAA